jgi:hypothetical protein
MFPFVFTRDMFPRWSQIVKFMNKGMSCDCACTHCNKLQIVLFSLHKFYIFVYLENITCYTFWIHGGTESTEIKTWNFVRCVLVQQQAVDWGRLWRSEHGLHTMKLLKMHLRKLFGKNSDNVSVGALLWISLIVNIYLKLANYVVFLLPWDF